MAIRVLSNAVLDRRNGSAAVLFADIVSPKPGGPDVEMWDGVSPPFPYPTFDTRALARAVVLLQNTDVPGDDPARLVHHANMESADGRRWRSEIPEANWPDAPALLSCTVQVWDVGANVEGQPSDTFVCHLWFE